MAAWLSLVWYKSDKAMSDFPSKKTKNKNQTSLRLMFSCITGTIEDLDNDRLDVLAVVLLWSSFSEL